jgi:thiol-disulfide isomerase/thioredoxin
LALAGAGLTAQAQLALRPLDEMAFTQVLASNKGNVLLVNFWATWCAPCRAEMPLLVQLERTHRSKGLRMVTVSCDEPEDQLKAGQFLAQHQVLQPAYLKRVTEDEKFINFVDGKWSGALPALFLYDRSGRLAGSFVGETEIAALDQAIRKLL